MLYWYLVVSGQTKPFKHSIAFLECRRTACGSVAAEARDTGCPQKTNDLAREAVGCNGLFGGSLRDFRFAFARES
jgi:hypothetical protein